MAWLEAHSGGTHETRRPHYCRVPGPEGPDGLSPWNLDVPLDALEIRVDPEEGEGACATVGWTKPRGLYDYGRHYLAVGPRAPAWTVAHEVCYG